MPLPLLSRVSYLIALSLLPSTNSPTAAGAAQAPATVASASPSAGGWWSLLQTLDEGSAKQLVALVGAGGAAPLQAVGDGYAQPVWHVDKRVGKPERLKDGQVVNYQNVSLPICALTYDCERSPATCRSLLDKLMQADARATGFYLGDNALHCPDVIAAWRAAGDNVGLHSQSHAFMPKVDDARFRDDTHRVDTAVRAGLQSAPDPIYRFPYGAAAQRETEMLRGQGFEAFFWSVDTNDWRGRSGDQVAATGLTVSPGGIVLMHDTQGAIDGARTLVADLRKRGLEPVTVSALGATYYAQPRVWFPGPIHVAPKGAPPAPAETSGGLSADGRWVAAVSGGALYLFDTATASGLRVAGGISSVAWGPEDQVLAVGTADPQPQIYLLAPDVTAALQAGKAADSLDQVPTAVRVSALASSNTSPWFSADGKLLYWDRVGPSGRRTAAVVTLRAMTPWSVAAVTSRPSGAVVSVSMGGRTFRGTTPCRIVLPRVRQATTVSATVTAPGLAAKPLELTLTPGATAYADVALDNADSVSGEGAVSTAQ